MVINPSYSAVMVLSWKSLNFHRLVLSYHLIHKLHACFPLRACIASSVLACNDILEY